MTASKAQWNQQLLLTPEWNPFCLSVWPFLIYLLGLGTSGEAASFLGDQHCQSFDLPSLVQFICSPNPWFVLCSSQLPAYQLSPTYKISVYGMESSKMEAAFTTHFLFSVYLICQALKFGKLHFRTELKIQYCTFYRRKCISFRMWNPFVSGNRIPEWFGLVGTLKTI